ncbi:MAG: transposase [Desulfobulbaceae bacterium]|nr:transposase [Desulfobulbaceae bacterium]HIJ89295.1 transposase [Deltaproteobacteria bacterium]
MSRPLRIEYPGAWYHVMNRGRRKEKIFTNQEDYESFGQVLMETAEAWNLKVSAYCLMSNHYHLLLQTPDGNISRCMRHINGVYTQRFNRAHKKDGQLFRGRYKSVLVEEDSHLLEVMRYIHRNPLSAGIAKRLDDYPFSSHHGYLSSAKEWDWLCKDFLFEMLSTVKEQGRAAYLDFVSQAEPEAISRFYSMKKLPSLLGGDAFKAWIKEQFHHLAFQAEIPESRAVAPEPEEIISRVCSYFKIDKQTLQASRRGSENLPRDIAIYLVRRYSRKTLVETGIYFRIGNYSTVSSVVGRIQSHKGNNRILQDHLASITAGWLPVGDLP